MGSDAAVRRFEAGAPIAAPAVFGPRGRLIVGTVRGSVRALDPATGTSPWSAEVGASVTGAALVDEAGIVVPTEEALVALQGDGSEAWRHRPDHVTWSGSAFRTPPRRGADHLVVAGCDDTRVYGIEPGGGLRWATPTGLPVRSAVGFDPDGHVLVAGLDLHLYSLHPSDGAVRWRCALENAVGAHVTVADDGTVVLGTLGGVLVAFRSDATPVWTRTVGAPIIGAVIPFAGGFAAVSADGRVVALDHRGERRWERALPANVRAAPAAGRAPTGDDWLFVVDDAGLLHVFGPDGRVEARFEAWAGRFPADPALVGVAVGAAGVALTAAAGEVWFLPWNAPSLEPRGWTVRPAPTGAPGLQFCPTGPITVQVGQVASLRACHGADSVAAQLRGPVGGAADGLELRLTAEGRHLHVVAPAEPGEYHAQPVLGYLAQGQRHEVEASIEVRVQAPADPVPAVFQLRGLRIAEPALVAAADGSALSALVLDVAVFDETDGRAVAWGWLRGDAGDGAVAFRAERAQGAWVLQAEAARIPFLGRSVPVAHLRLVVGSAVASCVAEGRVGDLRPPNPLSRLVDHPQAALERSGKPFLAARGWWRQVGSALSGARPSQLARWSVGAGRALAALPRLLDGRVWGPWGVWDAERNWLCIGQLDMRAIDPTAASVQVDEVRADAVRRTVTAVFRGEVPDPIRLGLLLVETRDLPDPLPIDYGGRTTRRVARGATEIELELPLAVHLARPVEVWVIADLQVVWTGPLTERG